MRKVDILITYRSAVNYVAVCSRRGLVRDILTVFHTWKTDVGLSVEQRLQLFNLQVLFAKLLRLLYFIQSHVCVREVLQLLTPQLALFWPISWGNPWAAHTGSSLQTTLWTNWKTLVSLIISMMYSRCESWTWVLLHDSGICSSRSSWKQSQHCTICFLSVQFYEKAN